MERKTQPKKRISNNGSCNNTKGKSSNFSYSLYYFNRKSTIQVILKCWICFVEFYFWLAPLPIEGGGRTIHAFYIDGERNQTVIPYKVSSTLAKSQLLIYQLYISFFWIVFMSVDFVC